MAEKETVLTVILDGELGDSDLTQLLGHRVKSVVSKVRDAPRGWFLGDARGLGFGRPIEAIRSIRDNASGTEFGVMLYHPKDQVSGFAIGDFWDSKLKWLNRNGIHEERIADEMWHRWKLTIQ